MLNTSVVSFAVTRAVPRHTRCEHCEAEYVYHLERTGFGESGHGLSDSQEQANHKAATAAFANLERELSTGAEAVPCPECFRYQSHMLEAARKEEWGWVRGLGGQALGWGPLVMVGAVLVAVVAFPQDTDTAMAVSLGVSLLVLLIGVLAVLVFRFGKCNPNEWSEAYRKQQAEALAVPRDDFDLLMLNGGPYVADLVTGCEADYAGVAFLWVRPDEIADEATVPLELADGTEIDVELSDADDDGVFLSGDRLNPAPDGLRVCLRIFSVYRPHNATDEGDS